MEKFYNCRYDMAFKLLFCNDTDTYLIEKFILNGLHMEVEKLEFLNKELAIDFFEERKKIVDSLIRINDNAYLNIEVNSSKSKETALRNYCYFQKIINSNTKKNEDYNVTDQFIQIDLTYGLPKTDNRKIVETYQMKNEDGSLLYVDNVKMIEYDMDKILDLWYHRNDKDKQEEIEKYKYLMMLGLDREKLRIFSEEHKEDEFIMTYRKKIEEANDKKQFEPFLTYAEDVRFQINTARNIGKEEGIEKGRVEEKEETARNMLRDKVDIALISRYTNLPTSQIMSLR